jgi:hypothetical protein
MPPLPPVPKVLRLILTYHISNDLSAVNRFHWGYSGNAPLNTDCTTFAGLVATAWASYMGPVTHSSVSLVGTEITDLSTPSGGTGSNAGVHAGTHTGTALPAGTCALVNYTIQRRYRGGKPRSYLPAGSSSDVGDGQKWSTAGRSAIENGWLSFLLQAESTPPAGSGALRRVSVSYYSGFKTHEGSTGRMTNIPLLRTTGPVIDDILTTSVDAEFASQRRRERP